MSQQYLELENGVGMTMKRYWRSLEPWQKTTVFFLVIVIVFVIMVSQARPGTYIIRQPLSYGVVTPDTIRFAVYALDPDSSVKVDSTIPGDSIGAWLTNNMIIVTLDQDTAYRHELWEMWYGTNTWERPETKVYGVQTPTASFTGSTIDTVNWVVGGYIDSIGKNMTEQGGDLGAGANQWNVFIADSVDTGGVAGALVTIRNLAGGTELTWRTGTSAIVPFQVDLDSFTVTAAKSGTAMTMLNPDDTLIVVSDGQTDTVYVRFGNLSVPPAGSTPVATVNLYYYRHAAAVEGAYLMVRNENIVTDTINDIVMGPIRLDGYTDTLGLVQVNVPRSYVFHDSLKALYDITLFYNGREVNQWPDYWIPNQDTVRLVVTN